MDAISFYSFVMGASAVVAVVCAVHLARVVSLARRAAQERISYRIGRLECDVERLKR